MEYFLISCIFTIFAVTAALNFAYEEKFELSPREKPFSGLRRGSIHDVIPNSKDRIVNGQFASKGQIPYQAGLLIGFKNNEYAWCGGTIIGKEWILTAAHCTSGAKTIEVRLGSVYADRPLHTVWGYENHIHDGWHRNDDDIALVKIPSIDNNANMSSAVLPVLNGQHSQYVNSKAIASGWGSINDEGQGSNQLKYVLMTVIDRNACARVYGSYANRPAILCTNAKSFGNTCSGDSGGPLVLENTRMLIGVVAFGAANGCTLGFPAGFTRVTYYLDWIKQVSGIYS